MRFGRFPWTSGLVAVFIASCGIAGPARASFVSADAPPFVGQFQAFIHDFAQWNTSHQDMPLTFLATAPESQRMQALVMLWLLWMRDHVGTVSDTSGGSIASVSNTSLPPQGGANGPPGGGGGPPGGGGGPPGGGGGPPGGGGHTAGVPEPSSLVLLGCGSLGLLAYRLVRSRRICKHG